jgi:tetratricopeptide (TPR) repeat protein
LAELSFLDAPQMPPPPSYGRQALLVRPNDPTVCLEVGVQSWRAGDRASAGRCWKRACWLQPDIEWKLLPFLVQQCSVRDVVTLIPLDFNGLKWLAQEEAKRGRIAAQRYAVAQARTLVADDPIQSRNPNAWTALHDLCQEAGLAAEAEECLRRALRLAPTQVGYHLQLVHWLMDQGLWQEALDQAHCARARFPGQPEVQRLVAEILGNRPVRAETNARRLNHS